MSRTGRRTGPRRPGGPSARVLPGRSPLDRDILRLAVPALGALVAEPLFLLTDTALVGHLGASSLAGLGVASAVLQTILGLLVFLAYATTPAVARRLGAGDRPGAIRAGIDGMWLAIALGIVLLAVFLPTSGAIVGWFGADADATTAAATYLSISVLGLPAMVLVLAATGLLRGLQDTRTPLVIAASGFGANAILNAVLIYGFGWGIAGSAWGTVIAQWGMAVAYLILAVRAARATGVSLRPGLGGVGGAAASGGWLLVRAASLRAAMLATVYVGAGLGVRELGALQIALTLFATLAFILDALAIAAQAMVGHGLGAGNGGHVSAVTSRLVTWGVGSGVGIGALLAVSAPVLGVVFTPDAGVQRMLAAAVLVMAVGVPLAGYVFVLDGVLIGAGDARYLALSGIVNLAVYLPLAMAVHAADLRGATGLVWLWVVFGFGYIGARALTLGWRARSGHWLVLGDAIA
ncbi:MATE family efflux transporter [Planctomonas psychrotolerans]|uniref:MATE family efflux transporter n=1 Tax=Planctomonas psychrotolerans TaxID=2528712 RepID=UPI001238C774|nr:MATE family efflux transporter [Planctomonas psychrotolerans]